jgi:ATP synthase F1 epsilon subunit
MAKTIKLEIVTPKGIAYSDDVDIVTLRSVEGQIGVLANHVRLMTQLVPGDLIVRKGGHADFLAVGGGLVEVRGDRISIATDMAIGGRHKRSSRRRSTTASGSSPTGEDFFGRGSSRQCVVGSLAGTVACEASPSRVKDTQQISTVVAIDFPETPFRANFRFFM